MDNPNEDPKTTKPAGRPYKYTVEDICEALKESNGLVSIAAKNLGCNALTIYKRARKSVAIQEAMKEAREELIDIAELSLRAAVMQQQGWAVGLVLKTIGKERGYVERQEIVGKNNEPITITVKYEHRAEPAGTAPEAEANQE